ncbi:hypothetical protein JANAI62_23190 [Jannaschia pagri]|uniref:HEPN domain-containing protein n=1 Tax=Jannaschia pagri TaxID=2829797 RepID=A0ABQ4NMR8_9RHOB|nr:hypothetical protein [Jannaschia sp. AI_62]GIT91862.1 hypothetical protein JANAI61_23200 [Jannaschia sp. AI_61]GIT95696.1 hypothetical protein JANAI62_23190 [Jannaschia sp. AI_62]
MVGTPSRPHPKYVRVARDYLRAAQLVDAEYKHGDIRFQMPSLALLCHGTELALKSMLIANPGAAKKAGHKLHEAFDMLSGQPAADHVFAEAENAMRDLLAQKTRTYVVESDSGEAADISDSGEDLQIVARDCSQSFEVSDLLAFWGRRHATDGGMFRYPGWERDRRYMAWTADGLIDAGALALGAWATALVAALEKRLRAPETSEQS